MTIKYGILWVVLIVFSGCSLFSGDEDEVKGDPIARVYDKYLYAEDLAELGLKGISPEDSIKIVNDYIENWIRHNLMLAYAEDNLPPSRLDIEKQIQDYRESLIIYSYEREYINQNLDTTISEQQIEQFYKENSKNFTLNNDIFRLHYLKLVNDSPKMDSVRLWMKSGRLIDEEKLRDYAFQYAMDFNMSDSVWIDTRIINSVFPGPATEKIEFQNRGYFETVDSPYVYIGKILDFKIKENLAPLSYVRNDISKIILNKRKLELLKELNNSIYKDASQRNKFEIYN